MPGADANIPGDSSPEKYDLAGKPSTNTPEVMQLYDEFAPTYDDTLLSRLFQSTPQPYLPRHPDFGDKIQVQYFVLRVR